MKGYPKHNTSAFKQVKGAGSMEFAGKHEESLEKMGVVTPEQFKASMDTVQAGLYHAKDYRGGRAIEGRSKPAWLESAKELGLSTGFGVKSFRPTSTQIQRSMKRILQYFEQNKEK